VVRVGLSILSQLLPLLHAEGAVGREGEDFQFFPSCFGAPGAGGGSGAAIFQFFPSCFRGRKAGGVVEGEREGFQFFPSCFSQNPILNE